MWARGGASAEPKLLPAATEGQDLAQLGRKLKGRLGSNSGRSKEREWTQASSGLRGFLSTILSGIPLNLKELLSYDTLSYGLSEPRKPLKPSSAFVTRY